MPQEVGQSLNPIAVMPLLSLLPELGGRLCSELTSNLLSCLFPERFFPRMLRARIPRWMNSSGEPDAARVMDDNVYEQPFCWKCSESILSHLTAPISGRHAECSLHVPTCCDLCATDGETTLYRRMTVSIPWKTFWVLVSSSESKAAVKTRNQHINMCVHLEGRSHEDYGPREAAMHMFLPKIAAAQKTRLGGKTNINTRLHWRVFAMVCLIVWCRWPDRFLNPSTATQVIVAIYLLIITAVTLGFGLGAKGAMMASPWRIVAGTESVTAVKTNEAGAPKEDVGPTSRASVEQERSNANGSTVATRVVVDGDLVEVSKGRTPVLRPPSEVREMPTVLGKTAAGADIRENPEKRVDRVAPLIGNAVVYDNKDDCTLAHAVKPRLQMADEHYNPSEVMRKKSKAFLNAAKRHLFTPEAIERAALKMPIVEELMKKKVSVDKFTELWNEAISTEARERSMQLKLEATMKPEKPARIIIDEGLLRAVINSVACFVFEEVWFDFTDALSIKHESKMDAAERITDWFSKFPGNAVTVEVDQTRFEKHQTYDDAGDDKGLLEDEYELLKHIAHNLPEAMFTNLPAFKNILEEYKRDVPIKAKTKKGATPYKIFLAYMRWSGFKLTSAGNFYNEFKATLCCFVQNPEKIFKSLEHRERTSCGLKVNPSDRELTFTGLDGKPLVFKPITEGDDFAGQTDRRVLEWRDSPEEEPGAWVLRGYKELGLAAKLKFVDGKANRRLEVVGLHIPISFGKSRPGVYVPDVLRGLTTSGVSTTTCIDKGLAIALRFWAKAIMMGRRCPPMAAYYAALAEEWSSGQAKVCIYDKDIAFAVGENVEQSVASLKRMYEDECAQAVTSAQATHLLAVSCEADVSSEEYARFMAGASTVRRDTDPDTVYAFLPHVFVEKLRASFS